MSTAPSAIAHEKDSLINSPRDKWPWIGVGGSIGTGILLGSGAAMQIAGPAAILSFATAAFICFTVTMALGELASAHPAAGSFGVYGELYLNPSAILARAGYLDRPGAHPRRRGSPTAAPHSHRSGRQRPISTIIRRTPHIL